MNDPMHKHAAWQTTCATLLVWRETYAGLAEIVNEIALEVQFCQRQYFFHLPSHSDQILLLSRALTYSHVHSQKHAHTRHLLTPSPTMT